MGDADGKGGEDPNQKFDEERARGEDPKLANISEAQNKDHEARPAPFKITSQGQ